MKINKTHINPKLKARPERFLRSVKGVVIHWTANENKGADADAHFRYINNNPDISAFAHYFVDDKGIQEMIPSNELAYHVGARKYTKTGKSLMEGGYSPNNFLIGIEMCVNKDGDFDVTYNSSVALARLLLSTYGLTINDLYRHYDITGKLCPKMLIDEDSWNKFKKDVTECETVITGIERQHDFDVKITAKLLNAREYPTIASKVITQYDKGTIVGVSAINNGWYKTDLGWISSEYTEDLNCKDETVFDVYESGTMAKGKILANPRLNIRKEPTADSAVIGKLSKGQVVDIYEQKNTWYSVDEGWIHSNYVTIIDETDE